MRKKAVCGTISGYGRHIKKKERPCEACTQANRAHVLKWQREHRDYKNAYQREWYAKNADKMRAEGREWYAENREKELARQADKRRRLPESVKNAWIKTTHGISLEEKRKLWEAQGSRCAIGVTCGGIEMPFEDSAVDHCYQTAEAKPKPDGTAVRGLCCQHCNRLLGVLGDDLDGVRSFRTKLERFEQYLTKTFPETQRRLAAIRSKSSL